MSKEKVIQQLEPAFGFKLPSDKKKIIEYDHKTPMSINSCAGAGKTTLLLFDILFQELYKHVYPQQILAVTFSKKAQLDMLHKYQDYVDELKMHGVRVPNHSKPNFSTFHALFLHLLIRFPKYRRAKILNSYHTIQLQLLKSLVVPSKALSNNQVLNMIFNFRSFLINSTYSYDGLTLTQYGKEQTDLYTDKNGSLMPKDNDDNFMENYLSVVTTYNDYKKQTKQIDFNDMKTLLMQEMTNHKSKEKVQKIMGKYLYCFIDEFQDIDPSQWFLMKEILSKTAFKHLSVIGDDDQSIYSFRGSDPRIIMNFTKNVPQAKLFRLSTNYRTNGKVLASARPVVTKNKYRIDKSLKADHNARGGTYVIMNSKYGSSGEALLSKALQEYLRHPHIIRGKIAILARYNTDRMIAVDWLANHKVYISHQAILQSNPIYKVFYNIIYAFEMNQPKALFPCLKKLGFRRYRKHFLAVYHHTYPNLRMKLTTLIKNALKIDKHFHGTQSQVGKIDRNLEKMEESLKIDHTGKNLYRWAHDLTGKYYSYMKDKGYMSKAVINSISGYLGRELKSYKKTKNWIHNEQHKKQVFHSLKYDKGHSDPIQVLSIHQSKGLEFQNVFLFNQRYRQNYHNIKVQLEHYFKPQISGKKFLNTLLQIPKKQLGNLNDIDGPSDNTFFTDLVKELKVELDAQSRYLKRKYGTKKHYQKVYQRAKEKIFQQIIGNQQTKSNRMQNMQAKYQTIFPWTKDDCAEVEEERRLLYVALTRAKNNVIFNVPSDASPLLSDIAVDKHHILRVNREHQLAFVFPTNKVKVKKIKRHIMKEKMQMRKLLK